MPRASVRSVALFSLALSCSSTPAINFTGSGTPPSGVWDLGSNWSSSTIPDAVGDDVSFTAGTRITGLSADRQVGDFTTGGDLTFSFGGSGHAITVNDVFQHSTGTLTLQASMGLIINSNATASMTDMLAMSNGAGILNRGAMAFGTGAIPSVGFTPITTAFVPNSYTFRNDGAATFYSNTHLALNNAVVINTGTTMIATGVSTLLLNSYTQTDPAGHNMTIVKGGTSLNANSINITAGTLLANGTINGSSTILGTGSSGVFLSPGDDTTAIATLNFTGNPGTIGGSTWHFDLGGLSQGTQYDFISAWQNLNVGSLRLDVSLLNGFTPAPSDTFTIMSASNVSGMFSNATGSKITVPGAGTFDVAVGSNQVVLKNFAPVPEPSGAVLLFTGALALRARRRR